MSPRAASPIQSARNANQSRLYRVYVIRALREPILDRFEPCRSIMQTFVVGEKTFRWSGIARVSSRSSKARLRRAGSTVAFEFTELANESTSTRYRDTRATLYPPGGLNVLVEPLTSLAKENQGRGHDQGHTVKRSENFALCIKASIGRMYVDQLRRVDQRHWPLSEFYSGLMSRA